MKKPRFRWQFFPMVVLLLSLTACAAPATSVPPTTQLQPVTPTHTQPPTPAPSSTHTPRPLAATPTSRPTQTPLPTLSGSGGGVLAYVSDNSIQRDIYLMNADGSDQVALTNDPGWDNWPSWSPDGMYLAFTCRAPIAGQGGGICRIRVDGTERDQLTNANDWEPSWSPNGKYIVFASQRDGNPELYLMDAQGTYQRRLTHSSDDDWQAAWSPDSTRLAFARGPHGVWDIYIMDVSDGGIQGDASLVRLTENDVMDGFPAWSADGKRILFSSMRDGNKEIYIMNADGTDPQRLTNNPAEDSFPRWSPDNQHIAYVTSSVYSGVQSYEIMTMDADGSHPRFLTKTKMIEEACPNWRPGP